MNKRFKAAHNVGASASCFVGILKGIAVSIPKMGRSPELLNISNSFATSLRNLQAEFAKVKSAALWRRGRR